MLHAATAGVVVPAASRSRGVARRTPVSRGVPDANVKCHGATLGHGRTGLGPRHVCGGARGRVGFGVRGGDRVAAVNGAGGALEARRSCELKRTRRVRADAAAADAGSSDSVSSRPPNANAINLSDPWREPESAPFSNVSSRPRRFV